MYTRQILLCLLILTASNTYAQNNGVVVGGLWADQLSVSDVNGRPFENKYPDVTGSPWFNPAYNFATILLTDGKKYSNIRSKINLANQQLVFITANGAEAYLDAGKAKEIIFADTSANGIQSHKLQTGFPSIDKLNGFNFYEVLSEGKCTLLRSIVKEIAEQKNELSGEISKEFKTIENLYLYLNGEMKRLKKDKDFILVVLADRQVQLNQFIQSEKINCRNTDQLARLINFYNSLP